MLLSATEGYRTFVELSSLALTSPWLNSTAPRGDGHPVVTLPGFMASDDSTLILRRYLKRLGYKPVPWGLGRNLGPRGDLFEQMLAQIDELSHQHQQKVSIIGQSLGGIYARQLSRERPDLVRQVVTLGSPFAATTNRNGTNPVVGQLFESMTRLSREELLELPIFATDPGEPTPVPSTAIYSRYDGVASWQICKDHTEDHETENIEVVSSHCGMAMHPQIFSIISDRLAQPETRWQRYRPMTRRQPFGLSLA